MALSALLVLLPEPILPLDSVRHQLAHLVFVVAHLHYQHVIAAIRSSGLLVVLDAALPASALYLHDGFQPQYGSQYYCFGTAAPVLAARYSSHQNVADAIALNAPLCCAHLPQQLLLLFVLALSLMYVAFALHAHYFHATTTIHVVWFHLHVVIACSAALPRLGLINVLAAALIPEVCLLSALSFHGYPVADFPFLYDALYSEKHLPLLLGKRVALQVSLRLSD